MGQAYSITRSVQGAYDSVLEAVREALVDEGIAIVTEFDIRESFLKNLDVEVPPQIILGACQSGLAYQALQVDPSIAVLIPVNVVVRYVDEETTIVEAFDPATIAGLTGGDAVRRLATDARARIVAALNSLEN
ncbi:DUF302 domain-containing protein [Nocardioides marmorisolisilvae]|uniref:DUF302 domain-containing protein n=1 Tax=Nocardioides marmorisolisilvae TaxID=1542737 RepID=A0A3N0DZF7_9ACTN|nr:DUF302 domain-containing protein [Nocardioides marmorisolisilvae]RNL80886.1 DUF302 domain-containing protein [Nocardioides marmorisolisilvae]